MTNWIIKTGQSSVGRKGLVAFSGLFLVGFIIVHLLGNLLFYVSADAFNLYGYQLSKNRQIYLMLEIITLLGFLIHIVLVSWTTWLNWKARPVKYAKRKTHGKSTLFSANMGLTGAIVLAFVIVHVRGLRFGEKTSIPVPGGNGEMMYDLYALLIEKFSNDAIYTGFYVIAVCLVGGHLTHGLQSTAKSMGLYSGKLEKSFKLISIAFGVVIAVGFGSIPFYIWLNF